MAQQTASREGEGEEEVQEEGKEEEERDRRPGETGEEMDYHGRCWCLRREVRHHTTQHVAHV